MNKNKDAPVRTHLQARARPLAHALLARGPLHLQLGGQRRLERRAVRRQALVLRAAPRPPAAPAGGRIRISAGAVLLRVLLYCFAANYNRVGAQHPSSVASLQLS